MAGSEVRFNDKGDGLGRYDIFNFKQTNGKGYTYVKVGHWSEAGLVIDNLQTITWGVGEDSTVLPRSVCSEPCEIGEIKKGSDISCCWICTECKPWEYIVNETTCMPCEEGKWPHENKSECYELPLKYIRWYDPYAYIPSSIAVVGIVAVLYHFIIFVKHVNTPIVKASGRELCYVLLCGILFCYVMTFVIMAKPMYATCVIQRFGVSSKINFHTPSSLFL